MKKLNKFFAILVALAMMATLCVSMAFAENENMSDDVSITKTFKMPEGIVTPTKTFTFVFDQDTDAGNATEAPIPNRTIDFTDADEGTTDQGLKTINKAADVLDNVNFSKPGKYVYDVYEQQPTGDGAVGNVLTESTTANNATTTKTTTYSTKHYTMEVFVNNQRVVTGVVVKDGNTKVNNTDPEDGAANGFNFENKYTEKVTNTPTGKDDDTDDTKDGASAFVEKIVSAPDGYVDNDQAFTFSTTVEFAKVDPATSYTAKVVNKDGTPVNPAQNITFTDGVAQEYTLKNGQRLVFTAIDLGAKITTTETANADYNTTYTNNNAALVTADATATKVTNTYNKSTTPEGILISNLPYIALALVAIGGLVAYVVVRRKADDEA